MSKSLRVLVLARAYPNPILPQLGLWIAKPTTRLAGYCDVRVVSPVPWCPPLPNARVLSQYTRFRRVPRSEVHDDVKVDHPRFVVGPGNSTYALEARAYAASAVRVADRLHRERPFDLIHAHFIYPDGVVAARLAQRWRVPFVVSEHAPWTGWLDRPGVARQAVPAANQAAAILAVSSAVEATIRRYAGDGPRVEVVPIGVDADVFRLSANGGRQPNQILFVGFLNYVKGVDVLLQAMAQLSADDAPGQLLLVGGAFYRDTRRQEDRLKALASSLSLGERVEFLGRRSPAEVARLMAQSAVLVLPSRAESFGAVLVEALACGTPVVATRCGGPEEIVRPDVGELVPVGDPVSLAAALSRVLARNFDRGHLREYALDRFDWKRNVDRTLDLYRQVTR